MSTSTMPSAPSLVPVLLTSEAVRARLGISRTTLWRYIVKGWLHPQPTFRDGRAHIFNERDVIAIERRRGKEMPTPSDEPPQATTSTSPEGLCHDHSN